MVLLSSLSAAIGRRVYAKADYLLPSGSVKDRPVRSMVAAAAAAPGGVPNKTFIEATAGNTGLALAHALAGTEYRLIVTMPEGAPATLRDSCTALGATVRLGNGSAVYGDDDHFQTMAEAAAARGEGLYLNQFEAPANRAVHEAETGPQILSAVPDLSAFVIATGTGGTAAGVGAYLATASPTTRLVVTRVQGQKVTFEADGEGGMRGRLRSPEEVTEAGEASTVLKGVGSSRMYGNLKAAEPLVRGQVAMGPTGDVHSLHMCHALARHEGLLVGGSAGANVVAAAAYALTLPEGSAVATLLCEGGNKYTDTVFCQAWCAERSLPTGPAADDWSWMHNLTGLVVTEA
jgi:cysteine synthase